ncbi:putative cytokinetic ring protein SteA [Luteipulveratus flavus]|uniref:Cytokinetic ring protein SteA n=1 Tax=Luteipulveratus flavus TaxID=3031728 RepID=A0ABT6C5S9_9MICO|nr:putative cytokinetic ring protein SteA [Luteipulveratus sp. YIM 133296]MDF8264195.1 putative cytokinetic ring protein SteA [Luteipulveratus sp. YIM 133296]
MRFPLRRRVSPEPAGVGGTVRVDARTKNLTKRLRPGDVAVINHRDIDQVSAEALVACRPAAVVNAAESISGRYPNLGPSILVEAGIPLLDHVGEPVMAAVSDGESARVHDGELIVGDTVIARGTVLDAAAIEVAMTDARAGLSTQMEAFAANTMEYLLQERDLLLDGVGLPDIRTDMEGRHVLVVVRGYHYKEDLQMLRPFIRDYKPVLIGVDGGADALVEAGLKPTMIVGDMDSVSDSTLRCGAEVVVHAYRDGRAPGLSRVQELGVKDPVVFPATGTSEDIAMLLADDKGADLIVAVGTHATLVEFLDKGRAGMASTFLTRLRVGSKLVDAKGVSRLYRTSVPTWMLVVLVLAGFLALFVALGSTPAGDTIFQLLGSRWDAFWSWLTGVFE